MPRSEARRDRARLLRRRATDAERELWKRLRERLPIEGSYFRRQVPIGPYFVDFVCYRHRLIIELDGSQHGTEVGQTADAVRSRYLEQCGFRVLRFWNHQIFLELEAVLDTIYAALQNTSVGDALSPAEGLTTSSDAGSEVSAIVHEPRP